jgi:hypothetical protein
MIKAPYLFAIVMMMSAPLLGQQSSGKLYEKLRLEELLVFGGVSHDKSYPGSLATFMLLAPNSEIIKTHSINAYPRLVRPFYTNSPVVNVMLGVGLNRQRPEAAENTSLLRVGIRYSKGIHRSFQNHNTDYFTLDTVRNSQFEVIGTIDSVASEWYSMSYGSDQIHFDAAIVFATDQAHRFAIVGGIGFTVGFSLRTGTTIGLRKTSQLNAVISQGDHWYHTTYGFKSNSESETVKSSGNSAAGVYLPIGIHFRLGKRGGLAKRILLYYEIRPGLAFIAIKGVDHMITSGIQQGLGVRYRW